VGRMDPTEVASPAPNLPGNTDHLGRQSPPGPGERRDPKSMARVCPQLGDVTCILCPSPEDSSTLAPVGLFVRVPQAPTHHGDSIVQERLAKHDDEEGLIYMDLFEDGQHCHGVHG